MDYILEFLWTVFFRIPLIIMCSIFTILFFLFTFTILVIGGVVDVFLHITGLAKDQTSSNIKSTYDVHKF